MSQNEAILQHLQSGKTLTPLQALTEYNCLSLSSRISDLKNGYGHNIKSEFIKVGNKNVAQYSMEVLR